MTDDTENTCIEEGCTRPCHVGRQGPYPRYYPYCKEHQNIYFAQFEKKLALRRKYDALHITELLQRQQEAKEYKPRRYNPYRCNARGCEAHRAEDSEFCEAHTAKFAERCQGESWRGGRKEYVGRG